MQSLMNRPSLAWLWLVAVMAVVGCGSGERTYDLSGAVVYQGRPVPAGSIVFEPDTSKGNKGAAGFAKIKDGRFDTRQAGGKGTVGGPHLVRILGLDGVARGELINGSPLFPEYNTAADLPQENGTKDFDVPRERRAAGP
jgi:hypothetical protein